MEELKYTVGDIDEVVDEYGASTILLRKVAWNTNKEKLELRKWFIDVDKERAGRGVAFLTEDGPSNLVKVLIRHNYCDTFDCLEVLKERDDFEPSLIKLIGKKQVDNLKSSEVTDELSSYFDPKELSNRNEQ